MKDNDCHGKLSDIGALGLKSDPTLYLLCDLGQMNHSEPQFTHLQNISLQGCADLVRSENI